MSNKQTMRYSDGELEIIKSTFAEQDELLIALRKSLLQMPMNAVDLSLVELAKKPAILALLRKVLLPTLDPDAPFHQLVDLWMTLQIGDKIPAEMRPIMVARQTVISYLDQELSFLEGQKVSNRIIFADLIPNKDKTDWEAYSDLLARNTIIAHLEMQLNGLKMLGGQKDETVDQTKERLKKDSAK